jgi:hypothetical protein
VPSRNIGWMREKDRIERGVCQGFGWPKGDIGGPGRSRGEVGGGVDDREKSGSLTAWSRNSTFDMVVKGLSGVRYFFDDPKFFLRRVE